MENRTAKHTLLSILALSSMSGSTSSKKKKSIQVIGLPKKKYAKRQKRIAMQKASRKINRH